MTEKRKRSIPRIIKVFILLAAAAVLLLMTVLVLINRPTASVLSSAELDVLKSAGVLRVGVDEDVPGLFQNGDGYEKDCSMKAILKELRDAEETNVAKILFR